MAAIEAPEGIKIAPHPANNLAITNFDEYVTPDPVIIGTLAAGEVKTVTVTGVSTIFMGATVLARPSNPQAAIYNFDKLLVKFVWIDFEPNTVNIMVKNDSDAEVTYGDDCWVLSYWNTNDLSPYDPDTTQVLP